MMRANESAALLSLQLGILALTALSACASKERPPLPEAVGLLCEASLGMPPTGPYASASVGLRNAGVQRAEDDVAAFQLWLERAGRRVSVGVDDRTTGKPIWRMDYDHPAFEQGSLELTAFYELHVLRHPTTAELLQVRCRQRHARASHPKGS